MYAVLPVLLPAGGTVVPDERTTALRVRFATTTGPEEKTGWLKMSAGVKLIVPPEGAPLMVTTSVSIVMTSPDTQPVMGVFTVMEFALGVAVAVVAGVLVVP